MNTLTVATREPLVARLSQVARKVTAVLDFLSPAGGPSAEPELLNKVPQFARRLEWFLRYRPDLAQLVSHWNAPGRGRRRLLKRMLDETEFLSPYGVRALSRAHAEHPYVFRVNSADLSVRYQPAESDSGLFGGNSNWRGPIFSQTLVRTAAAWWGDRTGRSARLLVAPTIAGGVRA